MASVVTPEPVTTGLDTHYSVDDRAPFGYVEGHDVADLILRPLVQH